MAKQVIIYSRAGGGFRRGGIAHKPGRDEHPFERFTDEQLAAIKAEPLLHVEIVDLPEPKGDGKAGGKAGQ